ncbi:MAG: DUF998 domain-containing protein [Thaumarchaeota archaeon]|nr:MAG: DUF998 domain-containing protein [Nitrososphaerota archaeon]
MICQLGILVDPAPELDDSRLELLYFLQKAFHRASDLSCFLPHLLIFHETGVERCPACGWRRADGDVPEEFRTAFRYSGFYPVTPEPPLLNYPSGREAKVAGAALFAGVVQFALAMLLAEFLYPGYSVSGNAISDLGATCTKGVCHAVQPSSTIFNLSIILAGILVLVSGYYLRRAVRANAIVAFTLVAGAAAYKVERSPLSYFSVLLGIFSLVATILYVDGVYLGLGGGGMERMIVYPVLLWSIAFSGQLIAEGRTLG